MQRYGLWASARIWPADPDAVAEAAREIERLGFGAIWIGGSPPDDLALAEAILAATSTLTVGTSIVDIWTSDGDRLAASHARLRQAYPGRFYLGVGSGHAPTAESRGQSYTRPLTRLREFLTGPLAEVPAKERMIAALGPKTLQTAGELTAGALPYLMPPAHTAEARQILGDGPLLVPEQKVFLGTDAAVARQAGRQALKIYLPLPNYTRQLVRYGLDESDLAGPGSDRLIDSAVVWGDDDRVRAGIDAHLDAGADHVAVQVLTEAGSPRELPLAEWRRLAALLGLDQA
ncbi:LLM class F420-dependent oxidoreductase [Actinoplanes lobatus]|uniref:LLM class F420-dependent oxidoreductase n=1 Tax=Actinoplanes lobatus TaxID=113568 RepID=A0A7W7HM98_9ACTN|nr:TIGR03620 family F420-dependent LLM class oxidoreductase [Actinoplanes lobatus]MBB4753071.1 putative F420-dependent oxidoreductase [Actinoplanes lobatus]GGN87171.1 LLM class F420-dependent oxidoreductase [Actinoplanes lobatus]GIE39678.1 LLM class F420-dependent oxidoreductase [Actinoplanes lobatus]